MAKFSERHKRTLEKKDGGSIKYALGCIFIVIIIPILLIGYNIISNAQNNSISTRVKPKYEEGLESSFSKNWVLIGSEFKAEEKIITYTVKITKDDIPDNLNIQYRKVDTNTFLGTLTRIDAKTYEVKIDAETLGAGKIELEAVATSEAIQGKKWTAESSQINISYGLYVIWTMDWEGMDVSQTQINQMSKISTDHHNLPLTHFFNPRIYVALSAAQQNLQTNYVKERRDKFGDEIGLHFHMWLDMVRAAGVEPKRSPAWNSKDQLSSGNGYDVPISAYNYEESVKLFKWADSIFASKGLGKPISFRAGGWYLGLDNVKAMEATGYKVDSSGRDARFWGRGYIASPWSLGSTTKPYKISTEALNSDSPPPRYNVWEIPNNGADSYWFAADDMITALKDNYQDKPLTQRKVVVILSHPHWFSVDYPKLQKFYGIADGIYYPQDKGPVLYTTLEKYVGILESDPNQKYKD